MKNAKPRVDAVRTANGTTLDVRVVPRSPRSRVDGRRGEAILIRLAAPPVDGAANEALVALLADELDVARRSIRIVSGPYRWIRHPNYAAVAGELAGASIMMRAIVAGPIATVGFTALMLARIRIEERALRFERR